MNIEPSQNTTAIRREKIQLVNRVFVGQAHSEVQSRPKDTSAGLERGALLKSQARAKALQDGAIAQLGERIVRNDEVVGSSPTSSTKSFNHLRYPICFATFPIEEEWSLGH